MAKRQKTGGRGAGTPNKTTEQIRESIQKALNFIDGNETQFKRDINALSPAERLKLYVSLLEYVQPKLARTEMAAQYQHVQSEDTEFTVNIINGRKRD
jgi:hypothetical protein